MRQGKRMEQTTHKSTAVNPRELVLWGRHKDAEVWAEEVLSTKPENFDRVKELAGAAGYIGFRVATLGGLPDFAGTVRKL